VDANQVSVTSAGRKPVKIAVYDDKRVIEPGKTIIFAYKGTSLKYSKKEKEDKELCMI
jgi:ASC-1-like (ASCH) protein